MQRLHGLDFVKSGRWKGLALSLCAMGTVPYTVQAKWKTGYIDAPKDIAAWYTVHVARFHAEPFTASPKAFMTANSKARLVCSATVISG